MLETDYILLWGKKKKKKDIDGNSPKNTHLRNYEKGNKVLNYKLKNKAKLRENLRLFFKTKQTKNK